MSAERIHWLRADPATGRCGTPGCTVCAAADAGTPTEGSVTHESPLDRSVVTACCGRRPAELPDGDRITTLGRVTCMPGGGPPPTVSWAGNPSSRQRRRTLEEAMLADIVRLIEHERTAALVCGDRPALADRAEARWREMYPGLAAFELRARPPHLRPTVARKVRT